MALIAVLRESEAHMVWIFSIAEVGLMAAYARRRRSHETAANVATNAVQRCMRSHQWKARYLAVVEARAQPGIKASVALLTIAGKAARLMVR
jgi:hypothetical protein